MTTLCTLFDHNYLDKGLVMYESLEKVCDEFELYVLAMSDRCYEILTDLNYPHLKPIKLEDFEDEDLLKVKPTRGIGEYCWTCTPSIILYVLQNFHPEYCTYVDADLYFYSDPKAIIEEMKVKNASLQVIGHRFNTKGKEASERVVGKYCVEFDTFKNDINGLKLVRIWRNQCLEHCSIDGDGVYWGDQKYQDNWCRDYNFCIETENLGAGVAPWNISQYQQKGTVLYNKQYKRTCNLLFYHFENIEYIADNKVNINIPSIVYCDRNLVVSLYTNYLRHVRDCKQRLKTQYGLDVFIKHHPGVTDNAEKHSLSLKQLIMDIKIYIIHKCNIISF